MLQTSLPSPHDTREDPHYSSGSDVSAESSKARRSKKTTGLPCRVTSKRIISAPATISSQLRGKEALQRTITLKLCHLLLDALLQSFVPFSELGGLGLKMS